MKKVLFILSLLCWSLIVSAQTPITFKYQGVARDVDQQPYANAVIGLRFSIIEDNGGGNGQGDLEYVERHLTLTSPVGIFSLEIGGGEPTFGDWESLDWGEHDYWLRVEMDVNGGDDYVFMGNSQILPVPLAVHALSVVDKDDADADPENELQTISFNPQTNQLSISDGNTINIPAGNADADPDPENELQSLQLNGLSLSISEGNTVNLANIQDGTEDADADPENELQMISFNAQTSELSISEGNTINIPAGNADADADPENELQTLQLNGLSLSISEGNAVNLANIQDGTEDADANPENELQTISFDPETNELSISEGNTISIPAGSADADADPENELQLLQLNGLSLSISEGNAVNLANIQDGTEDADADPDNELQTLQLNGLSLSISEGNVVNLASLQDGIEDADADPNNELQSLSYDEATSTLSLTDGGVVDLSDLGGMGSDNQTLALEGSILNIENGNGVDLSIIQDGTEDADADPANELQTLQLNGLNLSISDGNQINLAQVQDGTEDADADPNNELQTLAFVEATNSISINGGNTISLPFNPDDNDADPFNELQNLSLNGNLLSLSNGNQVNLSGIGGGSLWTQTPGHLKTLDNVIIGLNQNANVLSTLEVKDDITIRRSTGAAYVDLFGATNGGNVILYRANGTGGSNDISVNLSSTPRGGYLDLRNTNSGIRSILEVNSSGGVDFGMSYPDGDEALSINTFNSSAGFLLSQPDGDDCIRMGASSFGGFVAAYGSGGNIVADLGRNPSSTNSGALRLYSPAGDDNVFISTSDNNGEISLRNNGNETVYLGRSTAQRDGKVSIFDSALGTELAGMFITGGGTGTLFADVKNFRMNHPTASDKEIWYACVEGPEAAAYERGTAQLVNGEAVITFPEHFELVANYETMTVMLTPLSADCKGLAVVEKTAQGFQVKELFQGTGTYQFDWEVKCVRRGYEDYQVIRDKKERL